MRKVWVALMSTLLVCCMSDRFSEKIESSNYHFLALDGMNNMELVFDDGNYVLSVVGSTVFASALSDSFLIVKQHPSIQGSGIDKSRVLYYILPLNAKEYDEAKSNRIGPLSRQEFSMKSIELGIANDVKFKVFEDLE